MAGGIRRQRGARLASMWGRGLVTSHLLWVAGVNTTRHVTGISIRLLLLLRLRLRLRLLLAVVGGCGGRTLVDGAVPWNRLRSLLLLSVAIKLRWLDGGPALL
jgi:hypothetical protein